MASHLLIVEDDELVQALLAAYLQNDGFKVSLACMGKEMFGILNGEAVDLILLGLPDEDGLTSARQIRARSAVPIIVITARLERDHRIAALELGADDYMTKPFDPQELLLRIHNLLDRSSSGDPADAGSGDRQRPDVLHFDGWAMDIGGHTLTNPEGEPVALTRAEFNLLAAMAKVPNRVLSRDHLLDAVSRHDESPSDRMIDVLVSRLRKKIEIDPKNPRMIITILGSGYKFTTGG
jgi:two-component system torCAD operon response regulator TorR